MKKTLLTAALAVGIGSTGIVAGGQAEASEQPNVDQAYLAHLALNNPEKLKETPVQQGAYNIEFQYGGYEFDFESNGNTWTWEYHTPGFDLQATPVAKETLQEVAMNGEAPLQQAPVQTYQAPVTPKPQPAVQQTSSNVNVNTHLQQIAQRESGGNIHVINHTSGAAGKYQFLQGTWDTVAPTEWKGKSPASAPEAVQDAAAVKLYNEYGAQHWVTA